MNKIKYSTFKLRMHILLAYAVMKLEIKQKIHTYRYT